MTWSVQTIYRVLRTASGSRSPAPVVAGNRGHRRLATLAFGLLLVVVTLALVAPAAGAGDGSPAGGTVVAGSPSSSIADAGSPSSSIADASSPAGDVADAGSPSSDVADASSSASSIANAGSPAGGTAAAAAADSLSNGYPDLTEPRSQSNGTDEGGNVTQVYGGPPVAHIQSLQDIVRTPDGGMLALQADINETTRSTVLRIAADGEVTSREVVDGQLRDVERVAPGSYAAVGPRGNDSLMAWIDASGSVDWTETFGGDGTDVATDVVSAPDGDAYLLASTESFGVDTSDMRVVRVDAAGEVVWERLVAHEKWTSFPEGVRLADGSLVATIRTERSMDKSVDGQQNVSVVRLAPDGSTTWRTVVVGDARPNDKEEMFDVVPAHGEGVLITGASNSGNSEDENFDLWVARLGPDGELRWQRQYDGPREFGTRTVRTADGYVLAAFSERQYSPGVVGKLYAIDADGNERGNVTFTQIPHLDNRFNALDWTTRGRLVVGGITMNRSLPRSAAWIVDMTDAMPYVEPGPSVWETQHPNAPAGDGGGGSGDGSGASSGDGSADAGAGGSEGADAGDGDGDAAGGGGDDVGTPGGTVHPSVEESSMDVVLYAATVLSVVVLFVPYGLRRFRRR